MAKTYAESVKLPNLVSVPHPASRMGHFGVKNATATLNVEGRGNTAEFVLKSSERADRRIIISDLLENASRPLRKNGETAQTNSDQIVEIIDEKLTTGFHGIKHLFQSNDPAKVGRISKEGFRYIITQLCGYISQDAWLKLVAKFGLNENETISFDEFASRFENNQRVRKEIQASSNIIELVDFHRSVNSLADLTPRDWNHRTFMPELSATYCYSLLKAKARSVDFDPEQYLPRECFTNNKVVLSYHLKSMIGLLQLELSSAEFVKLWQRFDLNNLGGVQTKVFLRLLGYRPNELNELATSIEAVRYKKSRVLSNNLARRLLHRQDNMKKRTFSSHALTGASFGNFNDMSGSEDQNEEKNDDERPAAEGLPSARNVIEAIKEENAAIVEKPEVTVPATADLESPEQSSVKNDRQSARGENRRRDLKSASEYKFGIVNEPVASAGGAPNSGVDMKIKTLVRALKSARKFGPSQDLVSFLNAKLNEGYITFRTAFEYVDQERTNHLLVDEFKVVLEEFNVEMDEITYQKFLRKYGLLKSGNKLVDYHKFLQVFHDKEREFVRKNQPFNSDTSSKQVENHEPLRIAEYKVSALFQEAFMSAVQLFRNSIGPNNQHKCSQNYFKRLLEQKFAIVIDENQFGSLLDFMNQTRPAVAETKSGEAIAFVEWFELFKKFTDIDPWKCFKESPDRLAAKQRKPSASSRGGSARASAAGLRSAHLLVNETIKEEAAAPETAVVDNQVIREVDEGKRSDDEFALHSDDDTVAVLGHGNYTSSDDEHSLVYRDNGKFLKKRKARNHYSDITKEFNNEELKIKDLEAKVESIMRRQWHSINKYFSILDAQKTEKINKAGFKLIMHKVGVLFSDPEIDLLWKDLEDTILFSNLVRRFVKPEEFSRLRTIKHKIKMEKKIIEDTETKDKTAHRTNETSSLSLANFNSDSGLFLTPRQTKPHATRCPAHILVKARMSVVFNWKDLKREFQKIDKLNAASVLNSDALNLLQRFQIDLSNDELVELCKEFNVNLCEFDYVKFLKYFNPAQKKLKPRDLNSNPIINSITKQLVKKAREMNKANYKMHATDTLGESDTSDLKVLFKKFDSGKKGFLSHAEFKGLLALSQINISQEEEYAIFAEYDPELRNQFNYNLVLRSLIEKLYD